MKMGSLSLQPNVMAEELLSTLPIPFWILVILSGIGAGLGGAALMLLLRAVQHTAWDYSTGTFVDAVQQTLYIHRWLVVAGAGVLVGVGRKTLRKSFGDYGGEVSEAIWLNNARLPFWSTLARGIFSIVMVGLGAAMGREGAPKQVGAAISSKLSVWRNLSTDQRKLLVACGAGAGMAAVYNVPFGGALFAAEVLLGGISLPFIIPSLLCSLIAVTISWIALPNENTYATPFYEISTELFLGALLIGVLAGLIAIFYIRAISWAEIQRPSGKAIYFAPIGVFIVLGALSCFLPYLLGNGKDVVQLVFDNKLSMPLLLILVILMPCSTIACLSSGTPGGLFTPTVAAGSLLGAILGHCMQLFFGLEIGAWAILGAGAFLGASNKGPLSSLVLIMELRGHLDGMIIPLMLAITTATLICHIWEHHSIYSARIRPRKIHG